MTNVTERSMPQLFFDLMFAGLRVKDERLNAIAVEVLARMDPPPLRRLVLEAASRSNSPGFRIRALEAIERIGEVSDPADVMDLMTIVRDRNAQVREAGVKLIQAMGHRPPMALAQCFLENRA